MKLVKLMALALISASLSACHHKGFDFFYPEENIYVDVVYDDDNDSDDIAYLADKVSATRLRVYKTATATQAMATDMARKVNPLPLSADAYHFIAHNAGTQSINYTDQNVFHAHGVSTRECDILEPFYGSRAVQSDIDLGNGEPVVIACEPIWAAGAERVDCQPGDTVTLTATPLHCRYTYEMRNIEGLRGVKRVSSFITGMSHGAWLSTGELYDRRVTVAVPAQVSADGRSIEGAFMCFGHDPLIDARHRMGLFVEMENGARYKILYGPKFDVTDQVLAAPNRRRVHIVIDGVELPVTEIDAGFEATVNPWGDGENLDVDFDM